MPQLLIDQISKYFDENKVINQLSLSVEAGDFWAIVGESGSGKTTLLKLIACQIEPDEGAILLDKERLTNLPIKRLITGHPDIKLVAQDYQLKPDFKVAENIDWALRAYNTEYRKERVEELLHLCGLTHVANQKAKWVSGGEKQRTAIAAAIAESPKILLLDEPFSHLDSLNKQILKEKLAQIIKQEGITCLLVTHDLLDALTLAQKIVMMKEGIFLQIDSPQNFLQNPANEYIKQFVEAALMPLRVLRHYDI